MKKRLISLTTVLVFCFSFLSSRSPQVEAEETDALEQEITLIVKPVAESASEKKAQSTGRFPKTNEAIGGSLFLGGVLLTGGLLLYYRKRQREAN